MITLIYEPSPGEGPEPKLLGSPFNLTVQPGLAFGTESEEFARELLARVPQIRVVAGLAIELEPKSEAEPEPEPKSEPEPEPKSEPKPAKIKKAVK